MKSQPPDGALLYVYPYDAIREGVGAMMANAGWVDTLYCSHKAATQVRPADSQGSANPGNDG